jgi:hypothetical protein
VRRSAWEAGKSEVAHSINLYQEFSLTPPSPLPASLHLALPEPERRKKKGDAFRIFHSTDIIHRRSPLYLLSPLQRQLYFAVREYVVHCNKIPIYVFLEKELRGLSPNLHNNVSVDDL